MYKSIDFLLNAEQKKGTLVFSPFLGFQLGLHLKLCHFHEIEEILSSNNSIFIVTRHLIG